jgi:hypothetical protein
MKNYLLVIVTALCSISTGYGQTSVYYPMPSSTVFWGEYFSTPTITSYYQIAILGDTLIGADVYHKLYRHGNTCGDTLMTINNSTLFGGLREDNAKKVYFHSFAAGTFCKANESYKIYDFSKQTPGDTIQFQTSKTDNCLAYDFLTLKSVDSILIDKKYRKYYHFDHGENWIEGIGSVRNLLSAITPYPTCACVNALLCFREPAKVKYMNPVYNKCFCYTVLGINNMEAGEPIAFFPNPFSNETTLKINSTLVNADLIVYDAFGRQVKQMKNINGQSVVINREGLGKGLYYIFIIQDHTTVANSKLIIMDN